MQSWNPWHGCRKISSGCKNCYMFRRDKEFGRDPTEIKKTGNFNLPIKKTRQGIYKLVNDGNPIFTCGTSDFFLEEADEWRADAWHFIRSRMDLQFFIITKRIQRFHKMLPRDWGDGYENVSIGCTCENQGRSDYRIPLLLEAPIRRRIIVHEPMLEEIHIEKYLKTGRIEQVICGGESGDDARICDYGWILQTMTQCVKYNTSFRFKQTGTHFKRGSRIYTIDRSDQLTQAKKANINYCILNRK